MLTKIIKNDNIIHNKKLLKGSLYTRGDVNMGIKMTPDLVAASIMFGLQGIKGFNPSVEYSSKWISWTTNFGPFT